MERRRLLRGVVGSGMAAGALGRETSFARGLEPGSTYESAAEDWHAELTKRISGLEARGGGTLELGDGVYEIDKPLRLPRSVSLVMTPKAIIRARPGFQGDAVVIKTAGTSPDQSAYSGWIRGGVIDAGKQPLTGLRVENVSRLEISGLQVLDATYKGIHLLKGGYEANISHVRCDVDLRTHYAPGSIGIHYERGDSQVSMAHVIGYETGVRSDGGSNWFHMIHVWNYDPEQGPMKYCFYCNGSNDTYNQCYADSPTIAGFYMSKPYQSVFQCSVYYSRWAKDNAGAGVLVTPQGRHGTYLGNVMFADGKHRLAKAFDGDLSGACILGNSIRGVGRGVLGGLENRVPSGERGGPDSDPMSVPDPPLNLAGSGFRLTRLTEPPLPEQGELGEVRWVDDGQGSALWVKTTSGWKRAELR